MQTTEKKGWPYECRPTWLLILDEACGNSDNAKVGKLLGYSRTTISLVRSGKYVGDTKHVEEAVMSTLGRIHCPFLEYEISRLDCKNYCTDKAPTQNPSRMRHWSACQSCPNKLGGQ